MNCLQISFAIRVKYYVHPAAAVPLILSHPENNTAEDHQQMINDNIGLSYAAEIYAHKTQPKAKN
jgi:hypothetical protein